MILANRAICAGLMNLICDGLGEEVEGGFCRENVDMRRIGSRVLKERIK
jgi:hypothetical protein